MICFSPSHCQVIAHFIFPIDYHLKRQDKEQQKYFKVLKVKFHKLLTTLAKTLPRRIDEILRIESDDIYFQSYLFRTICQPALCYGTECINISHKDVTQLYSTQGQLIKRPLGLLKRSYYTELFQAKNMKRASDLVSQNACSLFRWIFSVSCPAINICLYHLSSCVLFDSVWGCMREASPWRTLGIRSYRTFCSDLA